MGAISANASLHKATNI